MQFSVYLYKYLMLITRIYWVTPKVWILMCRRALNVPSGWSFQPWNLPCIVEELCPGLLTALKLRWYLEVYWKVMTSTKFMSKTLKRFLWLRNQADFSPLVRQLCFFSVSFLRETLIKFYLCLGLPNNNIIEKKIWLVYRFPYVMVSPNSTC